jgi:beta-glucanase (GH16 family)
MHDDNTPTDSGAEGSSNDKLRRRGFLGTTGAVLGGSLLAGGASAAPYGGTRHAIPGRIEAEDYDTGGAGVAYNDTTAGNSGGAYRSDDVDIEAGGSGYNVGWTQAGEWLNYSSTIDAAGTYEVTARVASGGGGGSFILQEDQADLATFSVPDTGGWQSWTTVTQEVDLSGGDHMVSVYFETAGVNLDWLEFSQVGGGGSAISPGTYRLRNVNSGKVLEVAGGESSTANGDNVQQWSSNNGAWQQWTVEANGDGTYRLLNVNSGKALDVSDVSTSPGANVHQWDYVGGANQHWRIEPVGDGSHRLLADHSGLALDVSGARTSNGTNVQQWTPNGNDAQHWTFEAVDGGGGGGGGGTDNYPNLDGNSWSLAWNDEFDAGSIDTSNWSFETGGGCGQGGRLNTGCSWGNNEEQYYTDGDNAWVQNERLIIEAREETAPNGINPYTSARLNTAGTFEQQHGRVEVRARLPETQGLWPAIWMLGHDIGSVGWPNCGEVDIMELTGDNTTTVHGTVHGPGYSGGGGITSAYSGPDFSNGFHDFQIAWYPDRIKWFVDGNHYHTVTRTQVENAGNNWVFNDQFFIILNVAVGGTLPGYPDSTTQFPQRMEVEHVRVYDQA